MNKIFSDDGWSIIDCTNSPAGKYTYYARHDICKAQVKSWMDWDVRKCDDCSTTVPNDVQTLITLLIWKL